MERQVEAERKYALRRGQELPSLTAVGRPGPAEEFVLEATYYDAPDYRLTRAWRVIRRRVGGNDEGWHLKLPGDRPDERIELHEPVERRRLPAAFRERVEDVLEGAPVVPVAILRTRRREQQLLGPGDAVLATTCVDQVRATVGDHEQDWWEAEVELVEGDHGVLDRVEAVLAAAGIHRAATGSKIARALDEAMVQALSPDHSARGAVLAYIAQQVGVLQDREEAVRQDAPDAVHRSRVATRRLRSALRTYAGVFGHGTTKALRKELRWHAEELGAPRDAEVLRERLQASVPVLAPGDREVVAARIEAALAAAHDRVHRQLVESMGTDRYERLQLDLAQLVAAPRLDVMAQEQAAVVLPPMFDAAVERVRRLAAHAAARPGDLTRWHEVRKAAKTARYGAELLVPVLGERAERARALWEAVTEALGEMQDAVVSQRVIGELSWQAVTDGLPRLPFDDLRHEQDRLLRESLARGREALSAALAA
ncbi:CHAD domain-containing protein [Propionicimonas sp.]|uniref:CYTH and CHAD domain-containing protein n=1 Tax=Propionicimonas sp. TaxID=1955623 RepID=UPI0039E6CA44